MSSPGVLYHINPDLPPSVTKDRCRISGSSHRGLHVKKKSQIKTVRTDFEKDRRETRNAKDADMLD